MKRKVYFRADAGRDIGYGHFVRTLALADMLKEEFDCVFVTQTPTNYQRSEVLKVCQLVELPAAESRLGMFLDMLEGNEIVVLDNYFYDTGYQIAIKDKGCKLVVIDDIHNQHNVADVIINHGLSDRSLFDCEPYSKLCLGLEYAMLRRPFLKAVDDRNKRDGSIVICFGGADPLHLTDRVVEIVRAIVRQEGLTCRIKVILGDKTYLSDVNRDGVEVLTRLSAEEVHEVFCSSECAILSTSTICIEALYCHIPVCAGYYVDNQQEFYTVLSDVEKVSPLGYLPNVGMSDVMASLERIKSIPPSKLDGTKIKERYLRVFSEL